MGAALWHLGALTATAGVETAKQAEIAENESNAEVAEIAESQYSLRVLWSLR
jgi:hypothetical protein